MSFSKWFLRNRKGGPQTSQRPSIYIERPCIGCLRPFRKWGVTSIPLIEQFCSKRCEHSFFHGYDLGLRVLGSVSRWPKMGRR